MKKIIIALFVVIFLGAIIFVLTRKTSDWKTYSNTRYEFRIDYPSGWTLGEAESNNAGRELYSSNEEAYCYVYGFENALQNDQGNPQSLDEFIDWLAAEDGSGAGFNVRVKERNESTLAKEDAVHLLVEEDGSIKESVYALGKETGIGFFCTYRNMDTRNEYKSIFDKMRSGFRLDNQLNDDVAKELGACDDFVAGVFTPLKDRQIFYDDKYTEVTITSYEAWDRDRLPTQVTNLESRGYDCFPMPSDFDGGEAEGDVLPQPEVTMVEWSCELEYEEWEYLQGLEAMQPPDKFKEYSCSKEDCWSDDGSDGYVWLCTK